MSLLFWGIFGLDKPLSDCYNWVAGGVKRGCERAVLSRAKCRRHTVREESVASSLTVFSYDCYCLRGITKGVTDTKALVNATPQVSNAMFRPSSLKKEVFGDALLMRKLALNRLNLSN